MRTIVARALVGVVALIAACFLSFPSLAQDPARQKADATFKELYGPAFEKAAAGSPAVRIAFAKKLQVAAVDVDNDRELKAVILSKALKICPATQAGNMTALEIHAVMAADPRLKAEHSGELAALLEKVLLTEPPAGKTKVAGDVVAAYRAWAAEQMRRNDAGATKSLARAREVARTYLAAAPNHNELLAEIDEQAARVEKIISQNKETSRLTVLLDSDPNNMEAVVGLALIDFKNDQIKKAAERLGASKVKELSALGRALAGPASAAQEKAEAAVFAANVMTKPALKLGLLEIARQYFEAAAGSGKLSPSVNHQYLNILISLLAYESNANAKAKIADRLLSVAVNVAEEALEANDPDKASQVLADVRAAYKRSPNLQSSVAEFESFEKEFRPRLEAGRERLRLAGVLKKDPSDPKANWAMAMILLREGRPIDAAPYLAKADKPEARRLADLLLAANVSEFEKAEAMRAAGSGMTGQDKTAFLTAAVDFYDRFLQKSPDAPEASRAKLFVKQLSENLPHRDSLPSGVFALLNPAKLQPFVKAFMEKGQGDGTLSLDSKVHFVNPQSLRLTPIYRGMHDIPLWKHAIVENPQAGQYRYIAFAWKKQGGTKAAVFLGVTGGTWHPYAAGEAFENRLMVSKSLPEEWTVVVRDLYKDFGPFELSGISLNCDDGTAIYFDGIYLGRTEADVRKAISRRVRN